MDDGMECVITEQGLCQVPELSGVPLFNLNEELSRARQFRIEKAGPGRRKQVQHVSFAELERLTAGGEAAHPGEHEE
jgi:hypothetical protein